jgi:phosphatidylglycerol---prolipoprotein diacylglyceryl transferase
MQFPIEFSIGKLTLSAHLVFETLAFFIGFRYFLYLRKRKGDPYSSPNRLWVIIGAIFGSLIGSRLIGSLERPYELSQTTELFYYIANNRTVLGGFLGGLLGVELVKKLLGEKKASGDLFVYPILLALIIGRIGCFSSGIYEETYGNVTSLPWGMNLGDNLLRHPVCLYEIVFIILLWVTLRKMDASSKLEEGSLFKIFMISYLLFRFFLDFIKPHYNVLPGLSTIQVTAIAGLLYYLPYLVKPRKFFKPAYA